MAKVQIAVTKNRGNIEEVLDIYRDYVCLRSSSSDSLFIRKP